MCARGGGAIVNISTFAVFEPDPLFPTSGVFRAALASFTKLFADKYAISNVRMNNILPGFIDSLLETADRRARIPMRRYGTAGEISALVSYLCSQDAAYITGQNIRIDGGLTRSVLVPTPIQLRPRTQPEPNRPGHFGGARARGPRPRMGTPSTGPV